MNGSRRILVTGATGFVGRALVARLAADGWLVRASTRDGAPVVAGVTERVVMGEIDDTTDWRAALRQIDVVVHVAARVHVLKERTVDPLRAFRLVNRDATLRLARQAQESGVRRFVYLSTIGVNGSESVDHPLAAADKPQPHSPYAQSKWEAEMGLREITAAGTMNYVIIRPPLIVGPDPKGNLASLLHAIRKGLPLPLGAVTKNRRDVVLLDTLTDLIAVVVDHPMAANQTFLVSDGRVRSTREIVDLLAQLHRVKAHFLSIPPPLLAASLRLIGKGSLASQLCGNLEIDNSHTRATLNWTPPSLL